MTYYVSGLISALIAGAGKAVDFERVEIPPNGQSPPDCVLVWFRGQCFRVKIERMLIEEKTT